MNFSLALCHIWHYTVHWVYSTIFFLLVFFLFRTFANNKFSYDILNQKFEPMQNKRTKKTTTKNHFFDFSLFLVHSGFRYVREFCFFFFPHPTIVLSQEDILECMYTLWRLTYRNEFTNRKKTATLLITTTFRKYMQSNLILIPDILMYFLHFLTISMNNNYIRKKESK